MIERVWSSPYPLFPSKPANQDQAKLAESSLLAPVALDHEIRDGVSTTGHN